jgi:hypothetical protein
MGGGCANLWRCNRSRQTSFLFVVRRRDNVLYQLGLDERRVAAAAGAQGRAMSSSAGNQVNVPRAQAQAEEDDLMDGLLKAQAARRPRAVWARNNQ